MNQNSDTFNPFDPTGVFKNIRDASLDAWSKMMIQLVNSEPYARATGEILDTWLASSAPFRKAMEAVMTQVLTNANMPTRGDVIRLAERLTNIEVRLDDLEAKLEEARAEEAAPRPARRGRGARGGSNGGEARQ